MQSAYESEEYFRQILSKAIMAGASDVHLKVGQPPAARIRGEMVYFKTDRLTSDDTLCIAQHVNVLAQRDLQTVREFDTSYVLPSSGERFRVNVYHQRGSLALVMRVIPARVPTLEQLGLPPAYRSMMDRDRGLVLVVGAAGNGKSTSLAAMVHELNRTRPLHIVTIEDPIEFLHEDILSSISQREIGLDTDSFAGALRAALRQDPDVILVGEIRDEATMETALKAAETGHLVLSTLHTSDVARTVGRILALSPTTDVSELRDRLAHNLQGIIAQRLLPRRDNSGLILAAEILVCTGTVREAIRKPESNPSFKELMERGVSPYGMQTFEMHVKTLLSQGAIEREVARAAIQF